MGSIQRTGSLLRLPEGSLIEGTVEAQTVARIHCVLRYPQDTSTTHVVRGIFCRLGENPSTQSPEQDLSLRQRTARHDAMRGSWAASLSKSRCIFLTGQEDLISEYT